MTSEASIFGPSNSRLARVAPLILFLSALGVRVLYLTDHPLGLGGHVTAQFAVRQRLLEGFVLPIIRLDLATVREFPLRIVLLGDETAPVGLLEALGFAAWGVSPFTTRLMPALIGSLAVVLAYYLGKRLLDDRTGLFFACLLAFSPWHITLSRYDNLEHVFAPFHLLLSLLAVYRASQTGRAGSFLVAGLCVGLSFYVYATNQVVPAIVGVYLVYCCVFEKGFWRRNALGLILFATSFILVGLPQLSQWAKEWIGGSRYLPIRKGPEYVLASPELWLPNASAAFRELFIQVSDAWFSKPGPALGPLEMFLVLPALVIFAADLRRPASRNRGVFVLSWALLSLCPGLLGIGGVPFRRLILFATAASFLAARVLRELSLVRRPAILSLVAPTAVALASIWGIYVFFSFACVRETSTGAARAVLARAAIPRLGRDFLLIVYPGDDLADAIRMYGYDELHRLQRKGTAEADLYRILWPKKCSDLRRASLGLPDRTLRILVSAEDQAIVTRCHGELEGLLPESIVTVPIPTRFANCTTRRSFGGG